MNHETSPNPLLTRPEALRVGPHTSWRFLNALKVELGNLVPGQPLQINWRFTRFMDVKAPDWGLTWRGLITARFFVEGQLVHERSGNPVTDESNGTGNQVENIIVRDPTLAKIMYRFGRKWLEIEILRSDKPAASPYRWGQYFWVIPEPVDASWWQWRVAPFEELDWKEGYSLIGDFTNRSRFAKVETLTVELSEVRSDDNPQINPCDYYPVQIKKEAQIAARNGHVSIKFDLLHDWGWLVPGAFVITGALSKLFAYAVWLYFTDEYGNTYDGFCSPRIARSVEVSGSKQAAAVTALNAFASSVGLTAAAVAAAAVPFVGWVTSAGLFAAAGVAYGVAAAAAAAANDPPAPDPNHREPVTILLLPETQWPHELTTPEQLEALRSLLETAARIFALENARTLTRARLMSARIFVDEPAADQQWQGYLKIEREMVEAADQLERILPEVQKQVEASGYFDPEKMAVWLDALAQGGFSPAMHETMIKAGLGATKVNQLAALMVHRPLVESVKETGISLEAFVVDLQKFVQEIQKERETVLAGETYIPMPRRSEVISGEYPSPDPEARLRPRWKC